MSRYVLLAVVVSSMVASAAAGQGTVVADKMPLPPDLPLKPAKVFDEGKFRDLLFVPVLWSNLEINTAGKPSEEAPPVTNAELEKKLVGNETDARMLCRIAMGLKSERSPRASEFFDRSIAAYRRQIEKAPKRAEIHLELSTAYCEADRLGDAVLAMRRAIELDVADNVWPSVVLKTHHLLVRLLYESREPEVFFSNKVRPNRALSDAETREARWLLETLRRCEREMAKSADPVAASRA